ncbi:MAG: glycosyltransferase [Hyphomicrobiales bacterium]
MTKKVLCVVMNGVKTDVRVMKEAHSLRAAGYDVQLAGIIGSEETVNLVHEGFPLRLVAYTAHSRNLNTVNWFFSRSLMALAGLAFLVAGFFAARWLLPAEATFGHADAAALLVTVIIVAILLSRRQRIINILPPILELYNYFAYTYRGEPKAVVEEPDSDSALAERIPSNILRAIVSHGARSWIAHINGLNRAVYVAFRHAEFDIVHCHDFTALPAGVWLKRNRPQLKLVYDSHELFSAVFAESPVRHEWIRRFERRASSQIDACITVNDNIARILGEYYPRLPAPTVVCNATLKPASDEGADAGPGYDGRLHDAAKIAHDCKILLFQGGLARHRGLAQLTGAGGALPKDWRLVYMGWGNYEADIRTLAELADPTGEMIRFVPPVPQEELAAWTAGATLGAIPYEPVSLNHIYCSPNKIWEYPRSGVPILCSDAPEMTQRVRDYGIGWVIPQDQLTPLGIARIVATLSDEDLARAKLACAAFIEQDNWSVYEKRLLEVYARL